MSVCTFLLPQVAIVLLSTTFCGGKQSVNRLSESAAPITAMAVSPDGSVVVGSQDGIHVLDFPRLEIVTTLDTRLDQVEALRFDAHGNQLIAVGGSPGESGMLEHYDWSTKELLNRKSIHDDVVTDFARSTSGERIVTTSIDGLVGVHQDRSSYLGGHSKSVLAVCEVTSPSLTVTAGRDRSLRIWNSETNELLRTLDNHTGEVRVLRAHPSDHDRRGLSIIASAAADRTIRLWQPQIGRLMRFARLPSNPLDFVWSEDGTELLVVCEDGFLRVVDASTVEVVSERKIDDDWLYSIVVAPNNDGVIVGTRDGRLIHITKQQLDAD